MELLLAALLGYGVARFVGGAAATPPTQQHARGLRLLGEGGTPPAPPPAAPSHPLRGKIAPCAAGSAAPAGSAAMADRATVDGFRWCYVVGAGDSAGSIAEGIVGDDGRYQEVLLANPAVAKVGVPGVYSGTSAWDFAPGALVEGMRLELPEPWNRWVSQTGAPRDRHDPWPADARIPASHASGVAGSPRSWTPPAQQQRGRDQQHQQQGGGAPYGRVLSIDGWDAAAYGDA